MTTEQPEVKQTKIGEFLKDVKTTISVRTDTILDRAKDALVEKELSERKDLFLTGISKLQDLQRDAHKLKPDVDTDKFDAEGKMVGVPSFSKAKLEEIKKHKEQVAKVENAIDKAFGGDFSKLKELK